ncbi:DUF4252 domain-containing protein [Halosquirtibacter xylanolyticus]|uniref:DUF4252 domain-containing protein n=1 Tax=Halosquirtibacter xylanolyticus TaxID=3374599 RepID=UPI00374A4D1A|nr:DUF4252 domain-containing protein [Prolixibacteraceae bacterium]
MIKKIILIMTVLMSLSSYGQGNVRSYLSSLSGKKGYTTIEFTPFMFDMIRNAELETEGADDLFDNIDSMLLITTDENSILGTIKPLLLKDKYQLMMQMYDQDESHIIFYGLMKNKRVTDFIMIIDDKKDFLVLELQCDMTLDQLKTVTRQISVKGINNFK